MELKPQDTLLAIKYWALRRKAATSSVRQLAEALSISASEASKGAKRLIAARILVERDGQIFAESGALLEWLSYGVRYAYPQQSLGYGRGLPTSWNCPLLKSEMVPPSPAIVWSVPGGSTEGIIIAPIHISVPFAAGRDKDIYRVLSLVEAIRGGKPRELAIARDTLAKLIKEEA